METTQKRRRGRPAAGEGQGRQAEFIGVRVPRVLKEKIEQTAAAHGQSVSRECQARIEQSFIAGETLAEATQIAQRLAYGEQGAMLMQLFGRVLRHGPRVVGLDIEDGDWTKDPMAYRIMETEITHMLSLLQPVGDPLPDTEREAAKGRVERLLVGLKMIEPPSKWLEEDAQ